MLGLIAAGIAPTQARAAISFAAFPISVTPGHDRFPKVDGRYVVWTDVAFLGGPAGSTNDVYAYDLQQSQRITVADGPSQQDEPAISGSITVWTVSNPGTPDIFGRDLATSSPPFTVTAAPNPQSGQEISGKLVVWHEPGRIRARNLTQPLGSDFTVSAPASYDQIFPDVAGNIVVWMSFIEPGDQGNIYARDVSAGGGGVFPVTTSAGYQNLPKISGRAVVWNDARSGTPRVWGKNLDVGGEFPISSGVSPQYEVSIDGDLVVWRDDRAGVSDIWGRYLSGGPEFQITDTPLIWEDYPDVSGNVVVWEQSPDGNDTDIYGAVVPEPTSLFLTSAAAAAALARRRRPPAAQPREFFAHASI